MWTEPVVLVIVALPLVALVATQFAVTRPARAVACVALIAGGLVALVLIRKMLRENAAGAELRGRHCGNVARLIGVITTGLELDPPDVAMAEARAELWRPARQWIELGMEYCVGPAHEDGCDEALSAARSAPDLASMTEALDAIAESVRTGSACTPPTPGDTAPP